MPYNLAVMKLSIIIPVKNQSEKVYRNLTNHILPFFDAHPYDYEILIVSDGSSQEEQDKLVELSKPLEKVSLVPFEDIKGKGHAVNKGFLAASDDADYVIMMDADLATDLSCIDDLADKLGQYDAYLANRDHKQSKIKKRTFLRQLAHNFSVFLIRKRFKLKNIHDTQCGFKIYRTKIAKSMAKHELIKGFAYDVEHCYFLALNGFSTYEFPVHWENDEADSTVSVFSTSKQFYKDLSTIKKHRKDFILTEEEKKEILE